MLKKLMTKGQCDTLDQCGKGIFQNMNRSGLALTARHRPREKYPMSFRPDASALRIVFEVSAFRYGICD